MSINTATLPLASAFTFESEAPQKTAFALEQIDHNPLSKAISGGEYLKKWTLIEIDFNEDIFSNFSMSSLLSTTKETESAILFASSKCWELKQTDADFLSSFKEYLRQPFLSNISSPTIQAEIYDLAVQVFSPTPKVQQKKAHKDKLRDFRIHELFKSKLTTLICELPTKIFLKNDYSLQPHITTHLPNIIYGTSEKGKSTFKQEGFFVQITLIPEFNDYIMDKASLKVDLRSGEDMISLQYDTKSVIKCLNIISFQVLHQTIDCRSIQNAKFLKNRIDLLKYQIKKPRKELVNEITVLFHLKEYEIQCALPVWSTSLGGRNYDGFAPFHQDKNFIKSTFKYLKSLESLIRIHWNKIPDQMLIEQKSQ